MGSRNRKKFLTRRVLVMHFAAILFGGALAVPAAYYAGYHRTMDATDWQALEAGIPQMPKPAQNDVVVPPEVERALQLSPGMEVHLTHTEDGTMWTSSAPIPYAGAEGTMLTTVADAWWGMGLDCDESGSDVVAHSEFRPNLAFRAAALPEQGVVVLTAWTDAENSAAETAGAMVDLPSGPTGEGLRLVDQSSGGATYSTAVAADANAALNWYDAKVRQAGWNPAGFDGLTVPRGGRLYYSGDRSLLLSASPSETGCMLYAVVF